MDAPGTVMRLDLFLSRVAGELRAMAASVEPLHALPGLVDHTSAEVAMHLQSLDSVQQSLRSLAEVLEHCADHDAARACVDLRAGLGAMKLSGLAARLAGENGAAAAHGELHLF